MIHLTDDLSTITSISKLSLDKLAEKSCACICHHVLETLAEKKNIATIDIGIGTLYIKIDLDTVKYKFIPSTFLDRNVSKTLANNESPLAMLAENVLKERIEQAYKELL